jgi:hypothetical protein
MFQQGDIKEHMHIIATDGDMLASVDHVEGGTATIKLTRDQTSGVHHWIPLEWVKRVDKKGVHLNKSAEEVRQSWQENPPHA